MSSPSPAIDAAKFLQAAVREGMMAAKCAKELRAKVRGGDPAKTCVETGRLTAIQSEALVGLLRPRSIAEGFEVVGLLGYGGIGVVYRAAQPELDRIVALKTISADRLGATAASARFKQEARAVAKLKHPNIVTAYDYGRCLGGDTEGQFYLAMELVEGTDLDNHIRSNKTLDEYHAWHIVQQVAAALAHAHEVGIVHRDIKPANLLLTEPPAGYPLPAGVPLVKVTDFGLVQLRTGAAEPATRLTVSGATMGTPNYMAPEQINDAKVDHLADIYALGATAYHMLTGKPPYAGQSLMKVVTSKLTGDTEPLDSLPGDLTPPTRELLESMMSHDPAGRPQGYDELLRRVGRVLEGKGTDSRIVLQPLRSTARFSNTPSMLDAETVLSDSVIAVSSTRRRLLAGLASVGLMAAGGLWWVLQQRAPTPLWRAGLPRSGVPRDFGPGGWSVGDGTFETVIAAEGGAAFSGYKKFNGGVLWRMSDSRQWAEVGSPEHFGVSLRIALADAQAVSVVLRWSDRPSGEGVALRVEPDRLRFGRSGRLASPIAYQSSNAERQMRIELQRDELHWIAFRSDTRTEQVGSTLIRHADPPDELHLMAEGDAYLGEVSIYALDRKTDS